MRVVKPGERLAVELSVEAHRLPLPMLSALDMVSPGASAWPALTRAAPDCYELVLADVDGDRAAAIRTPNPGPREWVRDVEVRVVALHGDVVYPLSASHIAQVLVACGWTVTPPDGSVRPTWETPDGLSSKWRP